MTDLDDIHVLSSDLRGGACGTLFDFLKSNRGQPMTLDASAVERLDTLTAQLFVIAAKTWASDQQPFKIINSSERVRTTMTRLGLAECVELEGI